MSWFEKPAEAPARVPTEAIWAVCPSCKAYVAKAAWRAADKVCPRCNHHERLNCRERVALLTDAGSFKELSAEVSFSDPLSFSDSSGAYADKAKATIAKTGEGESILTGTATVEKIAVVLGVMDFKFLGGSLGSGTGERIRLAAEKAIALKRPLIIVSASGGARMHEGIVSLMQMAKTCAAIARVKEAGLPYLSILTDPTTGGVSASYAMVGDLNIAEPKALIGFAGRRVIEQTIKQKLPDDFQTAEYTLAHGFVDHIVPRKELKAFLANVLRYAGY
ncbi:MAG: acetyl-CoA carboxylase, carboxyltransferase subunit beta [Kiritimatiellia bacterium]|jgi:acetyl-CoA carboxylase carboxyl transferase subunit beta|nr:acetyl-CoA carboxylase, carboxyltransferase subunit beta [Kiritimatiellia bacterium]MDD4173472.1 acetyl-CoA carboxylase, carboxyltransferase subunit beta [Kiritimatiellia bacterium]MDD4441517.1 acetyl-CoA carboxylase, carboxyltransferase subunit beta [Kiritimatiellia bacterium]